MLEVSSYLPTDDFKRLRGICRDLDAALLTTFGRRHFHRLHLMPTPTSLAILNQISRHDRLGTYVKELCICSSVYQFWGARLPYVSTGGKWVRPKSRILSETEHPFPDASSPQEEATHVAVELLAAALESLRVQRIEVQSWPRYSLPSVPSSTLGLSDLIRLTGINSFKDNFCGVSPAWVYGTINMVTRMTEIVLSAVKGSATPINALIIDRIQIDQLNLPFGLGHSLSYLKHLEVSIVLSDQSLQFSDLEKRYDSFRLINKLPRLDQLALFNNPYSKENRLHLNDALMHLQPQRVEKLSLGLLQDAVPQIVPFLIRSMPLPRNLKLRLTLSSKGLRAKNPWNELFTALLNNLTLDRLVIDIDNHSLSPAETSRSRLISCGRPIICRVTGEAT
ncbi:hypothetical protein E4T47_09191 [Aureobasidium subglaciale]|nr:hypothetical protein E4T47_09191 [Aureobasidium subglaciale]